MIHRPIVVVLVLALCSASGGAAPRATAASHVGAGEAALQRLYAPPGFTRTSRKCFLNIPGEANVCFVRRSSVILTRKIMARWVRGEPVIPLPALGPGLTCIGVSRTLARSLGPRLTPETCDEPATAGHGRVLLVFSASSVVRINHGSLHSSTESIGSAGQTRIPGGTQINASAVASKSLG